MYDLAGEMKLIERELSAANDRIKELEAKMDELHDLEKWLEGR
jgi:predicted  nucleic acid-binding Zn-ribbon protein